MPIDYAQADKRTVLSAIRRKKLTPAQAARKFGVPLSGVLGWMRIEGLAIPPELDKPRRERSDEPLSAGAMGRRRDTDR